MSLFSQIIVPPTGIEAVLGKKQFGSQPGVEEPSTFVTIVGGSAGIVTAVVVVHSGILLLTF